MKNYTIIIIEGNSVGSTALGEVVREIPGPMELCNKMMIIIIIKYI